MLSHPKIWTPNLVVFSNTWKTFLSYLKIILFSLVLDDALRFFSQMIPEKSLVIFLPLRKAFIRVFPKTLKTKYWDLDLNTPSAILATLFLTWVISQTIQRSSHPLDNLPRENYCILHAIFPKPSINILVHVLIKELFFPAYTSHTLLINTILPNFHLIWSLYKIC